MLEPVCKHVTGRRTALTFQRIFSRKPLDKSPAFPKLDAMSPRELLGFFDSCLIAVTFDFFCV
jgi:hypothetical protein